jgi:hypothetical protein
MRFSQRVWMSPEGARFLGYGAAQFLPIWSQNGGQRLQKV